MPSIRKRVYGLIRTTFSPNNSVEDEFYEPISNPHSPTEEQPPQDNLPSPTTEQHSFIYQYLTGRMRRSGHPEIYYGKTGVDLPVLKLETVSPKVCASYTGPEGGLTEVPSVRNCPIANIANLDDEFTISLDGDSLFSETPCTSYQPRIIHDSTMDSFSLPSSLANSIHEALDNTLSWERWSERAYGTSTSLYETNPLTGTQAGYPIADVFGIITRENACFMALADGVNWGDRARLAGRCAIRGSLDYLDEKFFQTHNQPATTLDVFHTLLGAFHSGHQLILQEGGLLTTLCVAVVCKLMNSSNWVVCVCNVGDSLCFVYSKEHGVREVTQGSHDIRQMRDMRDAGGALGPVDGINPELQNLTCSMTFVEEGDIVFITSDGVSDNFDPVVGKFCIMKDRGNTDKENNLSPKQRVPNRKVIPNGNRVMVINGETQEKQRPKELDLRSKFDMSLPAVEAHQRHQLMLLRMEDLLKNGVSEGDKGTETAKDLCEYLVNFAQQLTMAKRRILEDPELYQGDTKNIIDQRQRRRMVRQKIIDMPGKLDHATVVGYTVGLWPAPDIEEPDSGKIDQDWTVVPGDPECTPLASRKHLNLEIDVKCHSPSDSELTPEAEETATYTIRMDSEVMAVSKLSDLCATTESEITVTSSITIEPFNPSKEMITNEYDVLSLRMIDEGSQSSSVNSNLDEKAEKLHSLQLTDAQPCDLDFGLEEPEVTSDFDEEAQLPELDENIPIDCLDENEPTDDVIKMAEFDYDDENTTVPSSVFDSEANACFECPKIESEVETIVKTRTSVVLESVLQCCDQITANVTVPDPTQAEIDELEDLHSQDMHCQEVRPPLKALNASYYEAMTSGDPVVISPVSDFHGDDSLPSTARTIYPEVASPKETTTKMGGLRESFLRKKKKKHERGSPARHTLSVDVSWFRKLMPSKSEAKKQEKSPSKSSHHGSILKLGKLKGLGGFNWSHDPKLPTTPEDEQPVIELGQEYIDTQPTVGNVLSHSASDTQISK